MVISTISYFYFYNDREPSTPPPVLHRSQSTEGAMMTPSQWIPLFCLQGKALGCRGVFDLITMLHSAQCVQGGDSNYNAHAWPAVLPVWLGIPRGITGRRQRGQHHHEREPNFPRRHAKLITLQCEPMASGATLS